MRRAFADFSPAVPAAFAAGLGVALWIFLLPAGVVQKGRTPVLPALGGTAGRVVADLPVPARARRSEVHEAVPAPSKLIVAPSPPAAKSRGVHHQSRTGMVRGAAPLQEAPVTKSQLFSMPAKAKGKARGHARGDEEEPKEETPTAHSHGHGKARGRSNEREDRVPPGQAKKAARGSAPGPLPSKGNGGGKGRKGNDGQNRGKDNGDQDRRGGEKE